MISRLFFSPRLWELGASWSRHEGSWHSSQLCPSLPLTVSVGVLFSFLPQCSFFSVSPPSFLLHVFISSFLDFFLPFICYIVLSSCLAIVLSFVFLPLLYPLPIFTFLLSSLPSHRTAHFLRGSGLPSLSNFTFQHPRKSNSSLQQSPTPASFLIAFKTESD